MKNVLIDHARSQRAGKRQWGNQVLNAECVFPSRDAHMDDRLVLRGAIHRVAETGRRQCSVLQLVIVQGFTIAETASALHIHPRTVKRVLHDIKENLRHELRHAC